MTRTKMLTGYCWSTCVIVSTTALIAIVSGRGIRNEADPVPVYAADPRDPVPYTERHKQPLVVYSVDGAYSNWDLGYYSMFYTRYRTFVGTNEHVAIIERIIASEDDDLKVCVNHDVSLGNLTLGAFTCPLPFEPNQFDLCCGFEDAEYCCSSKSAGRSGGIIAFLCIAFAIFLFGGLFYTFAGRQVGKKDNTVLR